MYDRLLKHGDLMARIGIHEASHVIMARLLGLHPDSINLSAEPLFRFGMRCQGYVQLRSRQHSDDPRDLWGNSLISAAGPIGELRFLQDTLVDPERLYEIKENLKFDGFAEGDCRHIAGFGRTLFGSLAGDDPLPEFARAAVDAARKMIMPHWEATIAIAESFILATQAMESVEPLQKQEQPQYEYSKQHQTKVSDRAENSGGETPSGMDGIPKIAIAR